MIFKNNYFSNTQIKTRKVDFKKTQESMRIFRNSYITKRHNYLLISSFEKNVLFYKYTGKMQKYIIV